MEQSSTNVTNRSAARGEPDEKQGGHRKNLFLNTSSTIIIEQLKVIPDN